MATKTFPLDKVLGAGTSATLQLSGTTSMDVVTAVAETDVAVSTLVSVRDKVIQAYEDIMRMPI